MPARYVAGEYVIMVSGVALVVLHCPLILTVRELVASILYICTVPPEIVPGTDRFPVIVMSPAETDPLILAVGASIEFHDAYPGV